MNDSLFMLQLNMQAILPQTVLLLFALVVMLVDAFGGGADDEHAGAKRAVPWIALVGILSSAAICVWLWGQTPVSFQGQAIDDHFALSVSLIVLMAAFLAVLFSNTYIEKVNRQVGEYYALILLCTVGMMFMGSATDLIVLFLALEIFSLALYILTGLHRTNPRSTEAAMKYFSARCLRVGLLCLWRGAALRRHRHNAIRFHRPEREQRPGRPVPALCRHCAADRGFRLQGEPGSLPYVDAGRLPGRADTGDCLHERRHQGGSRRRYGPTACAGAAGRAATVGLDSGHPRHADDDSGQPRGAPPAEPQAHARLLHNCPRRLCDDGARSRHRGRR